MSKFHIVVKRNGHFYATIHNPKEVKVAEIVGQGIKACEEILEAEDKLQEEDLKR